MSDEQPRAENMTAVPSVPASSSLTLTPIKLLALQALYHLVPDAVILTVRIAPPTTAMIPDPARSYAPQPAGPLRLDRQVKLGQFARSTMNDVVHARLAGLLDAAMFNRLQREPRDLQLGLEIAARRPRRRATIV